MKQIRSKSLDTLKQQSLQAQQQLKQQNSKSQLHCQESIQQKLHRIGAIQNISYNTINNANQHLSINSSKKEIGGDPQEIKLFVQQHNSNFNKLMGEKLDLEEEVKYLRGVNETLQTTQQQLQITKSRQNMDQKGIDQGTYKEFSSIKVDVMNYSIRNKELENELFQLQQQMRMYKMQITSDNCSPKKFLSNTDYDPHQFSSKISDLGKIIADQKSEIQSLQMKNKEKDRSIIEIKEHFNVLQSQINVIQSEREVLEKSHQNDIQRIKDSLGMELDSLKRLNKQLDGQILKAHNSLNEAEQQKHDLYVSGNRQINELQDELKRLNQQKTLIESELHQKLMELKVKNDEITLKFANKTKELDNIIQQWETKFYKQKMAFEREIEQLKELQDQRVELMKQEIQSKESQQLKKIDNFEQVLLDSEKDKNTKAELLKQMKLELEDAKAQIKINKDSYEIQLENLRQEIKRFGLSKNETMMKLDEKKKINKKLLIEIEGYKKEIKNLESSMALIQSQVEEMTRQQTDESSQIFDEKFSELELQFQKRSKELEDERLNELKVQRDKFIGEIISLEIKHKQEIERLKDNLEGYQIKDAQSQKSINARIQDVKDNYEEQIKHIHQYKESEITQIREEYEKQILTANNDISQKEYKLKQDYESVIQSQKLDFELNVKKPLQKELSDLQKISKEKVSSLESQLSLIQQEMQGQIAYQKNMLETHKKTFEGRLTQEKKQVEQLESKVEKQKKEIQQLQQTIQQQQEQIDQLNSLVRIIKCEKSEQCTFLEDEISKIQQSYTSKENEITNKFEKEISAIHIDNMKFTLKMKSKFEEMLQIEHEKYEKVLMEYEELLRLYLSKGCREVDAILISNLKEECLKSQEELKYLIIEVVNREKMYNKIFTNYQETEFMQMLLKRAENIENVKNMITNNSFTHKENERFSIEIPNLTDIIILPNVNLSTKNDFLPMVNTTKSFKGLKTEETAATTNNTSGPIKFIPKLANRAAIPSNQQYLPKQQQPHYMITQLNSTNSVFKGEGIQQYKQNFNSSNIINNNMNQNNQISQSGQQPSNLDQFNSLDIVQSSKNSQKYNLKALKANTQTNLNDSCLTENSNGRRKYAIRERRCLSQMSNYQDNENLKQNDYSHHASSLLHEEQQQQQLQQPQFLLNAQSVNIQKQPTTPQTQDNNVKRRQQYPSIKNSIKNKTYSGVNQTQTNQQRLSTENIGSTKYKHSNEQIPFSRDEYLMDKHENQQLQQLSQKSGEIQNHNQSQNICNPNASMCSQTSSSYSQPAESRKPSYAQIYAQIFMNNVSRVVKTSEGNTNHRKKFV